MIQKQTSSIQKMKFHTVNLKINYECNQECNFCYQKNRRDDSIFSIEKLSSIAKELKKMQVKNIQLSGGEPLLRKDITDVISLFSQEGFFTKLASNGLLLNREKTVDLAQAGLDELYISLKDVPDEKQIVTIRNIIQELNQSKSNLKIIVNLIVGKSFLKKAVPYLELLYKNNIRHLYIIPPKKCGDIQWFMQEKLELNDYLVLNQLIEKTENYFEYILDCGFNWIINMKEYKINSNQARVKEYSCPGTDYMFALLGDGSVTPCTFFQEKKYYAGNIYQKSLSDILDNNPVFDTFRSLKIQNNTILGQYPCLNVQ